MRTILFALVTSAAACGGEPRNPADAFVGSWSLVTGHNDASCADQPSKTLVFEFATQHMVLQPALEGISVNWSVAPNCFFPASVAGMEAVLLAGYTCSKDTNALAMQSGTLSVEDDELTTTFQTTSTTSAASCQAAFAMTFQRL